MDEIRITVAPGQPLVPPPEGARYLGFIFARAATPARVEAALRASHAQLVLDIDDAGSDTRGEATRRRRARHGRRLG